MPPERPYTVADIARIAADADKPNDAFWDTIPAGPLTARQKRLLPSGEGQTYVSYYGALGMRGKNSRLSEWLVEDLIDWLLHLPPPGHGRRARKHVTGPDGISKIRRERNKYSWRIYGPRRVVWESSLVELPAELLHIIRIDGGGDLDAA